MAEGVGLSPVRSSGARELDVALLIADLCGYTALTETHGALTASETVLRFVHLAKTCLDPGVSIVDSIGDEVFCSGTDTLAVVRTGLRLRDSIEREPEFLRVGIGIHRGPIVEREGRLFGAPINLTARLAAHAVGGQILCSDSIARAIDGSAGVTPRPIGTRYFKNVTHAVPLFELVRVSEQPVTTITDPVCRMQVTIEGAAATIVHEGILYQFCSTECARLFSDTPGAYVGATTAAGQGQAVTIDR
jgi:class 3 adenylate cyclase/YHS domain-containing protein